MQHIMFRPGSHFPETSQVKDDLKFLTNLFELPSSSNMGSEA